MSLTPKSLDSFKTRSLLDVNGKSYTYYDLKKLGADDKLAKLPVSIKILLENMLRFEDGETVTKDDVLAVLNWDAKAKPDHEIAFRPARVLLQDFTGVPAVVDLAVMRDAIKDLGGDPDKINPLLPADLVIDHSVQVDKFGTPTAFSENAEIEIARNRERYVFLRWDKKRLKISGLFHRTPGLFIRLIWNISPRLLSQKRPLMAPKSIRTLLSVPTPTPP